ncbi:MAG: TonB-dependent receptor [Saprospiraceae bacterium]|nr:TonB-dependent receptor [Saprospiraceae bacterium]
MSFIKFSVILLTLLCSLVHVNGQNPNTGIPGGEFILKGFVTDKASNLPLEFATISVFSKKDSSLIGGSLTETDGSFSIELKTADIYAVIEFLSYLPFTLNNVTTKSGSKILDAGKIFLSPDAVALEAVEIVGQKSETQFALDKRVFNVGKDLANRGGTVQDILDNVPSVTVDIDGGVSLRGSGSVRILINGQPSGLVGISGANGLRSIPAGMIERVEVITNPSARYEAEGMAGIINIVLKKDSRGGLNGSFEVSGGYPANGAANANINYRKGKTNFFLNYGLNYNDNPGKGYAYQEFYNGDSINTTYILRDGQRKNLSNSFRTGLDYSISDFQTLTASFLYRYSDNQNLTPIKYYDHVFTGEEPRGRFLVPTTDYILRTDTEKETSPTMEYTLDYRKTFKQEGKEFKTSIQYSSNDETENSDYAEGNYNSGIFGGNYLTQRSENAERQRTLIMQADYVLPLSKNSKFETGLRSSLRTISNDFIVEEFRNESEWFILPGLTNNFKYEEDVHAGYAIYGNKVKKLSYQAGLRAEYSNVNTELLQTDEFNPRTYFGLFPSGHVNYEFAGMNQVQVSYSRRIRRPRFWDLNPFFSFSDSRNIFAGNPNLDPEYTDSYEIGHIKYWEKGNIGTNVYYRNTTDVIQRIRTFDAVSGTSFTRPLNLATSEDMGFEFLFAYNPVKWFKLDGNLNIFRNITDGSFEGQDLSADSYSWFSRIGTRFTFWKNADLQLRLNYRAPVDIPQGINREVYIVDVAFSKDIAKNMTVTFAARDLFNTRRRNTELFGEDFYERSEQQWRRNPIVLTFNYRLNMQKERKKSGRGDGMDFEGDM